MPFRLTIDLFDCAKAIELRKQAGVRVSAIADPLSLDTLTGLPCEHDLRVRQAPPCASAELQALFDDWITVDPSPGPKHLNPAATLFVPSGAASPLPAHKLYTRGPPQTIRPIFALPRALDYRFSQISVDYRSMDDRTAGTIEAGFGIIHLFRDVQDVYRSDLPLPEVSAETALIEGNGCLVAVLSVPSVMTVSEFLLFVEPATEYVRQIRILRDEGINRCMALMRFRAIEEAEQFIDEFNGKPFFAMLEDELEAPPSSTLSNAVELPTCVVCLERMDSALTGLVTIPCQHTFHCTCLSKWASGRCPVCRYTQSKIKTATEVQPVADALCEQCGTESRLWMCLICGHVGCGRYAGRHAILHYEQLGHQYAMELESQRVWDYGGDQYVHRLIQNRPDGRLVELPSTLSSRDKLEGQSKGGLGPGVEDNLAQTKLERMSEEFAHLLATQLDSQRHYYFDKISDLKQSAMTEITVLEEELEQQKALLERHNAREGHLQAESSRMAEERTRLEARIREVESSLLPALEKEKARLSSKLEKAAEARATLLRDLEAEKQVTRGLMDNVTGARLQLKEAHDQNIKMKTEMAELQEQVNDLLANLSFRQRVDADPDMEGSSLTVVPAFVPSKATSAKKKKKPKKPSMVGGLGISMGEEAIEEAETTGS